jgi:hypothetical protein
MSTESKSTTAVGGSALSEGLGVLRRWWRGRGIPSGPQPCPHCGVQTVRAWAEGSGEDERFYIEHGDPLCPAGSKRLEVVLFSELEVRAFRHWTPNVEVKAAGRRPVAP